MGRHRREYPLGKLRLRYPKKGFDEKKAYTLYYEYTWLDDAPIRKDTGLRVRVADWNEKGTSGSKYDSQLQEYSIKHPHQITSEVIRAILNDAPLTRQDEGRDFVKYVKEILHSRYTTKRIGKSRYENGLSGMVIFQEFLISQNKGTYKKDSIYLGEISKELIEDYIIYRRSVKKNKDATINHSLTRFQKTSSNDNNNSKAVRMRRTAHRRTACRPLRHTLLHPQEPSGDGPGQRRAGRNGRLL